MTKPQILMLVAALMMIGTGLFFIASEEYSLGAVFSGVGATFASLSVALSGAAKAKGKEKETYDAG